MAASELPAVIHYLPPDSTLARLVKADTVPQGEELSDEFVESLVGRLQESERNRNTSKELVDIHDAYSRLFQEQAAELKSLADLYERFPRFLKVVDAPEQPTSESHVLARLRYDASRRRRIPYWHRKGVYPGREHNAHLRRNSHRFRYPHPTLVPYEWCLRLFKTVTRQNKVEDKLPQHLRAHFDRALDGVDFIYCHTPGKRLKRTTHTTGEDISFAQYPFSYGILPKPRLEVDWLESFVTITEWMAKEYSDITLSVASTHLSVLRRRLLADPSDYRLFVELESPRVVAKQLRADLKACRAYPSSALPSHLALYMPPWPSPRATEIARSLAPHRYCNNELLQLFYESKISEIRLMLRTMPAHDKQGDGHLLVADKIIQYHSESLFQNPPKKDLPAAEARVEQHQQEYVGTDLVTTAKTLQQLFKETPLHATATGNEILASILAHIENAESEEDFQEDGSWEESVKKYVVSRGGNALLYHCYICGRQNVKPHQTFSSMCRPCGDFNMAGSQLSLPPRLSLVGKVAAITGARVNLGYHITLRLLRCGAGVIASTRYPHDALSRYRAEKDSELWLDRLAIIGADFRSARDAFELAREIRLVVERWGGTLHILINNAAQTLTDSIEEERSSVSKEEQLKKSIGPSHSIPFTSYTPRVRAGITGGIDGPATQKLVTDDMSDTSGIGSSWVQSLDKIPYEDVISAHSVNAFVPLILLRELLSVMSDGPSVDASQEDARGYVVNVSSREGLFETGYHGFASAKNGMHVHTNMSKAALNMITETESETAWNERRVAINTVDPGYMSSAPEFDAREKPIGWEDGAGRVLWPIAVGELQKKGEEGCHVVWGRFLKHYGATRVNLQSGPR
ncbi:hypothetical protein GGR50DRAFT_469164 [Xylaria sp. CBS 124048]|nr:hypothetical protein GGR50DRAFT_469164 [Xylaria sp. CBS 124048]